MERESSWPVWGEVAAPTCVVSKLSQGPDRERGVLKSVLLEFSPAGNLAGAADGGFDKNTCLQGLPW